MTDLTTDDVTVRTEKKVFPEEDYEYTGSVNGKEWTGKLATGSMGFVEAEGVDKELTSAEQDVVMDAITEYFRSQ